MKILKLFLLLFIVYTSAFSQYYYTPASKIGNVEPFMHTKSKLPLYAPKNDLTIPKFSFSGYTKTYYKNGKFNYFGNGYMSYMDRQKLKAINGRYSKRYKILENQMHINNSKIKSQMYEKNPNKNIINSAVNDNFRIEMEMQIIRTLRELDINRSFR